MSDATLLKQCRHGRMLFLRRDRYIGTALEYYGEFSELESRLFPSLVRPGDVVVEVGANIGCHTLHLARLVGPRGLVLAFEPQRVIFHLLCANLALNEIFHVRAYHAAVGRVAGSLPVPPMDYAAGSNFGGVSLLGSTSGEAVPVTPLDAVALPSLRLLKVDVEGMEADVLAGAASQIARHRPLLYVENDRRENSAELIRMIEDLGYALWWHLPPLFNPENFAANTNNIFPGTVSINLLCVPKETQTRIEHLRRVTGPADWWQ